MGVMSAIMEFNPLLEEVAAERRGCPAHDLISTWAGAGMDPLSMMHETGLFIAGGAETTRTAIARGLAILAEHPDQWEAAAADSDARARARRGGHPLGDAAQQHVPPGPHRRPHRRASPCRRATG